jgi:hypothetical protein
VQDFFDLVGGVFCREVDLDIFGVQGVMEAVVDHHFFVEQPIGNYNDVAFACRQPDAVPAHFQNAAFIRATANPVSDLEGFFKCQQQTCKEAVECLLERDGQDNQRASQHDKGLVQGDSPDNVEQIKGNAADDQGAQGLSPHALQLEQFWWGKRGGRFDGWVGSRGRQPLDKKVEQGQQRVEQDQQKDCFYSDDGRLCGVHAQHKLQNQADEQQRQHHIAKEDDGSTEPRILLRDAHDHLGQHQDGEGGGDEQRGDPGDKRTL